MNQKEKHTAPDESQLPPELVAEWRSMLMRDSEDSRRAAGEFYFSNILPLVLEIIHDKPDHMKLRNIGFHTLISLMGFSPETTVISTDILRPQRLVIVYSSNTAESYESAFEFLVGNRILKVRQITPIEVDPTRHFAIYRKIRECILEQRDLEDKNHPLPHIVDVTGGKKVMSATAAQAAWELNLPLCYVESGRYDPSLRRPIPGHEVLQKLPDPGQEKGLQRRTSALDVYRSRNYNAALDAFAESKKFNIDHVLEEFGEAICACYAAWTDLNLPELHDLLGRLSAFAREAAMVRLFDQRSFDEGHLQRHLTALSAVAENETLALMATFFELAQLYREQKRHDFSCLLAYRCMEALVEFGLGHACDVPFRSSAPDYASLASAHGTTEPGLLEQYVSLSSELDKDRAEKALPRKVGFLQGVAILCLLKQVHNRFYGGNSVIQAVKMMREIADLRNSSVLAHGTKTLSEHDSRRMLDHAEKLASAIMDEAELSELKLLRRDLEPLPLAELQEVK